MVKRRHEITLAAVVCALVAGGCSGEATKAPGATGSNGRGADVATSAEAADPAIAEIDRFIAANVDRTKAGWRYSLKKPPLLSFTEGAKYVLSMETNRGPVKILLRPDRAPMHVSNAIYLTRLGFYDGNASHRAMMGFMIQAGSANGAGGGSPGYSLDLEADDSHVYDRPGLMAAARTPDPNSAGSQFFLMLAPNRGLSGGYTIYGELAEDAKTESMMTLRAMEEVSNPGDGPPRQPIVFERCTISVE